MASCGIYRAINDQAQVLTTAYNAGSLFLYVCVHVYEHTYMFIRAHIHRVGQK